jgi:hypothetical protein
VSGLHHHCTTLHHHCTSLHHHCTTLHCTRKHFPVKHRVRSACCITVVVVCVCACVCMCECSVCMARAITHTHMRAHRFRLHTHAHTHTTLTHTHTHTRARTHTTLTHTTPTHTTPTQTYTHTHTSTHIHTRRVQRPSQTCSSRTRWRSKSRAVLCGSNVYRVGQNPKYTVYTRYFLAGGITNQIYGHIRCVYIRFWPTLNIYFPAAYHPLHLSTVS